MSEIHYLVIKVLYLNLTVIEVIRYFDHMTHPSSFLKYHKKDVFLNNIKIAFVSDFSSIDKQRYKHHELVSCSKRGTIFFYIHIFF
jgi:hypothetical protein